MHTLTIRKSLEFHHIWRTNHPKTQHSVHVLRHTYATRTIEGDMQPRVLQKLLRHASIKTTMNRYIRITGDSLTDAVRQLEYSRILAE